MQNHDADTCNTARAEILAMLDYESQSGRMDERTIEALVIAEEVLLEAASEYAREEK